MGTELYLPIFVLSDIVKLKVTYLHSSFVLEFSSIVKIPANLRITMVL